jgi:hypothetical protein
MILAELHLYKVYRTRTTTAHTFAEETFNSWVAVLMTTFNQVGLGDI